MNGSLSDPRHRAVAFSLAGFVAATVLIVIFWWAGNPSKTSIPEFDTARAIPLVSQAIDEARNQVRQAPRSGPAWGRLGMLAMAHNFHHEAIACFVRAAELLPLQFRWIYYRGVIEEETDLTAAINSFEMAARLSPRYAPLRVRLARALMRLNQLDDAGDEFQAAAVFDPQSPFPRIGLGRLEMARGNLDAARDHFNEALALGAWSRDAHIELARVLNRLGQASSAHREQREAARLPARTEEMPDPILQEIEELELTGRQLSRRSDEAIGRGDFELAGTLLRELIRDRPDLSRPRMNLGQILQYQQRFSEAVDVFREGVATFPHESLAHFSLGTALEMSGEIEQAVIAYNTAVYLKPDYADAYFCLGTLLRKQTNIRGAVEAFQKAVSANPDFAPGHLALGLALADHGDREGAIEQVRLAVKLAPQDHESQHVLEGLLRDSATEP